MAEEIHAYSSFDEVMRAKWEKKRLPYHVEFELTPRCNFNCVHCYMCNCHGQHELSTHRILQIIDLLCEKGILFLTLTGGEILTRSDFAEIYMYAKRKGFLVELFTNGALFTDDIIEMLTKYPPIMLQISLYGANEDTYRSVTGISGAFERVISNLRKLNENKVRFMLKSPILTLTYPEVDEMKAIADNFGVPFVATYDLIHDINGDDCTLRYQVPTEIALKAEFENHERNKIEKRETPNDYELNNDAFIDKETVFSCKVGINGFTIDYEGNMMPCMNMRHHKQPINSTTFDFVWQQFGELQELKHKQDCDCVKCGMRESCDVCPGILEMLYGDYDHTEPKACACVAARKAFYGNKRSTEESIDVFRSYNKERRKANEL